MTNDANDAALSDLLAPPARTADQAFVARTARLIELDRRLEARERAGRQRVVAAVAAVAAAGAGLALLGDAPTVASLGGGAAAGPVAVLLMLLVVAAQSPALRDG